MTTLTARRQGVGTPATASPVKPRGWPRAVLTALAHFCLLLPRKRLHQNPGC